MDISLKDFLFLFASSNSNIFVFNILNTDNNTFPEKYRSKHYNASSLFNDLYSSNDVLLQKKIDYIALLPVDGINNENKFNFHFEYSYVKGFFTYDDEGYKKPLAPGISIYLKD